MPPAEERIPWAFVFTSVCSKVMVVKSGETWTGNGVRTGMTNFKVASVMVQKSLRRGFEGQVMTVTP